MPEQVFYTRPILNSPFEIPTRHWPQDKDGRVISDTPVDSRRSADFQTAIARPRASSELYLQTSHDGDALQKSGEDPIAVHINLIRKYVGEWRNAPKKDWKATPITASLLEWWRKPKDGKRPYFCQLEAVETAIWLEEVAPKKAETAKIIESLKEFNQAHNPGLFRIALKLATGAGKTLVMAMLIAWQTLNAVQRGKSGFTRAFLVVAPGLTIRDRLQVLKPNDPNSCYREFQLVPPAHMRELNMARIVITNYHAFRLREKYEVATGTRKAIQGWRETPMQTVETPGQMLERVMPQFSGLRNIIVFNDEAHHCYQARPAREKMEREERAEAEERNKNARLWISGLKEAAKKYGIACIYDLSATPYYLQGSGWPVNMIFPWTVSEFSLMDAIECGIVKLPRVPVSDNVDAGQPTYRELWPHIGKAMPKKGVNDPELLPGKLVTALETLYNHYEEVHEAWQKAGSEVPPCFIIVCNNTHTSKLVYELVSGYRRIAADGSEIVRKGRLPLFANFDENDQPLAKPRTLLIDSRQLEAGNALEPEFANAARDELDRFKREIILRRGKLASLVQAGHELPEAEILREVMNTVGKPGQLGGDIRCVVSVGMLTEGWDANTVTHILGIRAFGSQLLCEQVTGRALRRRNHTLGANGLYQVEYADIFGIPFNFAAKPTIVGPTPDVPLTHIHAMLPSRAVLEITFPKVLGYRLTPPAETLTASWDADSAYILRPEETGPTETLNAGIIGETVEMTPGDIAEARDNTIVMHLARDILEKYRDDDGTIKYHLYGAIRQIVAHWVKEKLKTQQGTKKGQVLLHPHRGIASEKILAAIMKGYGGEQKVRLLMAEPEIGSTATVDYMTAKRNFLEPERSKCQLNKLPMDSDWEKEMCRQLEKKGNNVLFYVKNYNLGFEIPYTFEGETRQYVPDFIALIDDGKGFDDPLHLIIEVKGFRGEDAKAKAAAVKNWWLPGVAQAGRYGRWSFVEVKSREEMEAKLGGGWLLPPTV